MEPSTERWQRIKNVLDQIVSVEREQREEWLAHRCEDERMRAEVLSLLELEDDAETFIDAPLWRAIDSEKEKSSEKNQRIGRYRIESLLGKGGMGEVYLAVREDDYEQKVAIKRTLSAMVRDRSSQRFVNERQILANLQHPGIARLLDGGDDDQGRPYLVMEYVEGEHIDRYSQNHELTIRQRLRLMSKVCRIVHFAHTNLVIHRDLKASNILVGEDGQPRLLDFGIAKLIRSEAELTVQGTAALTPACASPEQIMGERVTTACDVYALGVLLYRLLAKRAPYELDGLSFAEVRRIVCLQEVRKPSESAASPRDVPRNPDSAVFPAVDVTAAETAEAPIRRLRVRRQLRGDLDAVVMKAMRKEPEHRYGSAAEMADDIDRYLEGLPVEARRGSWFYHGFKHLRRNKPIVALMSLILALAVVAMLLAVRTEQQRREAVAASEVENALKNFLIKILESPDPDIAQGRDRTLRELVEQAIPELDELDGQPFVQAEMLTILGGVFAKLGDDERTLALFEQALELGDLESIPCSDRAKYTANMGLANYNLKRLVAAEKHYQHALAIRRGCGDDPLYIAKSINNLANTHMRQGKRDGVTELLQEALTLRREHHAPENEVASAYHSLGAWYLQDGAPSQAVEPLEKALSLRKQSEGALSTGVASVSKSLARAHHALGHLDHSRQIYQETIELYTTLYGADSKKLVGLHTHFIRLLIDRGEYEQASTLAESTLELGRSVLEPENSALPILQSVWALNEARLGRAAQPREWLEVAHRELVQDYGPDSFPARWTLAQLESLE